MDFIISIPGPQFLWMYACFVAIVIVLLKLYVVNDKTRHLEMPEPTKLLPLDVAYLEGGTRGDKNLSV